MPGGCPARRLVTVAVQSCVDCFFHATIDGGGAAQVTALFLAQPACQVACTALTVHRLALRGQAKAFLGAFVGFDFVTHRSLIKMYLSISEQLRADVNRGTYRKKCRWESADCGENQSRERNRAVSVGNAACSPPTPEPVGQIASGQIASGFHLPGQLPAGPGLRFCHIRLLAGRSCLAWLLGRRPANGHRRTSGQTLRGRGQK